MQSFSLAFVLSVISTAVSGVFAVAVLRRCWELRRPHLFAWGFGLALYCVGTLAQVILALTWSPLFFGYGTGAVR